MPRPQSIRHQYRQELARCRARFEQIDLTVERGYLFRFTTFSANISNLLPHIARAEHERLFQELLLQQVFTSFDQEFLSAADLITVQGRENISQQPRIYCTYHLGSYRMLTSLLFRQGVDCVLLVGQNAKATQGAEMQAHIDALRQQRGYTNEFRIVEAGGPASVLTLLRELKAGRSLIVYVDGSPETAPQPGEEAQMMAVDFGQRQLWTRQGVGYLSYSSGVPVVPVVGYRQPNLTNLLQFMTPLVPDRSIARDTYCQHVMQSLYRVLWKCVNRYPSQWEGWTFVHSFLKPQPQTPARPGQRPRQPTFNANRYALCDLEAAPTLFDRQLYQTYEISADLRDLLLQLGSITEPVAELVGDELFGELVDMEIIC
jgi:lauroyl/myristoyl acyltransferase